MTTNQQPEPGLPNVSVVAVGCESSDTAMLLYVDDTTGEVLYDRAAPNGSDDAKSIAEYVGNRLVYARGKLAGLVAERDVYLHTVSGRYDGPIKKAELLVTWLEGGAGFFEFLRSYADNILASRKVRSMRVSLLKLAFRKRSPRVVIADEARALAFFRASHPDAVKTVTSVLVSKLPDEFTDRILSGAVSPELMAEFGLRVEPEADVFTIS